MSERLSSPNAYMHQSAATHDTHCGAFEPQHSTAWRYNLRGATDCVVLPTARQLARPSRRADEASRFRLGVTRLLSSRHDTVCAQESAKCQEQKHGANAKRVLGRRREKLVGNDQQIERHAKEIVNGRTHFFGDPSRLHATDSREIAAKARL
eukprot:CAMPEP_0181239240 /NCGR_PEP_ID=MMETSP1096-20121128/39821_1 /TAXON_ID=156174 ORGANISM="Chrysochromulina ericina, Strain CCMP281" /NCGR_SAMPLE_ID=MMETSP1096 /ASSEMBLY_ACC=CAM_ASM_000453 /LENGTH=151 /DNA_ID=CAMNT_0023334909 /DNA_START=200 /DNA_END=651 /DNA_ORIENTATION=+